MSDLTPPADAPLPWNIHDDGFDEAEILDANGEAFIEVLSLKADAIPYLASAANATPGLQRELTIALGEISRMTARPAAEIIEAEKDYAGRLDAACAERNKLRVENAGLVAERDALREMNAAWSQWCQSQPSEESQRRLSDAKDALAAVQHRQPVPVGVASVAASPLAPLEAAIRTLDKETP